MNFCYILFIACSITKDQFPLDPRNSIPITTAFLLFLLDFCMLFIYYLLEGMHHEILFGVNNTPLAAFIFFSWPFSYLILFPFIVYRIMKRIGTPLDFWEYLFRGGTMSTENLRCDRSEGACSMILRYLCIGFPLLIVSIVYVALVTALSPLMYFVVTPLGMGMYSICLVVSFHSAQLKVTSISDRVARTYCWGMLLNVYGGALLGVLVSICYIALVAAHWWAILLLISSGVYFITCCFPAARGIFCSREPLFPNY
jgi:hypothetical protein